MSGSPSPQKNFNDKAFSSPFAGEKKQLEEKGISLRDHILEEAKGRDSPIKKQPTFKFSPSKSKYLTNNNKDNLNMEVLKQKIGDSSDSDEGGGGFRLTKIGGES